MPCLIRCVEDVVARGIWWHAEWCAKRKAAGACKQTRFFHMLSGTAHHIRPKPRRVCMSVAAAGGRRVLVSYRARTSISPKHNTQ